MFCWFGGSFLFLYIFLKRLTNVWVSFANVYSVCFEFLWLVLQKLQNRSFFFFEARLSIFSYEKSYTFVCFGWELLLCKCFSLPTSRQTTKKGFHKQPFDFSWPSFICTKKLLVQSIQPVFHVLKQFSF